MEKSSNSPPKMRDKNDRSLSPEKSTQAFMSQLKESRQAFNLFTEEVEKKGYMGKKMPLLHSQAHYYSRYIKNRNLPQLQSYDLNITSGETLPD